MTPTYKEDKKTKGTYGDADLLQEAIAIVDGERKQWSDAVAFVTDKVAFQMRNLIRNLRKNYWGVYDIGVDPMTGRQKVWVPLTRTLVESTVKNIDLDTKDINFRAKNEKGYSITRLIRALVKKFLDSVYFGETLDSSERALAIDGTIVWKTIEGTDDEGKSKLIRKDVDILNVYIDPTEDNIQSAFRFTERCLMLPDEIALMDGWMNTEDLQGSAMASRIDSMYQPISTGTTAKYRDVWEMWGKIPEYLITGKKDDKNLIDGHIVVSGLEVKGVKCHLIERNAKKIKPYEECRYSKVSNRWYGLGIAERVLMLQIWLNTIVNIRINRSYVSQLGLFKIRKGSGITPQMLSRLGANGAIVVNDPGDIEQMVMTEASQASYTDEANILNWAQRDTGNYDAVGEETPASKPATTSVIENNAQKSGFKLVKDALGSFIERWIDRHVLPILAKTVDVGELIELSGNEKELKSVVDTIVAHDADNLLEQMWSRGIVPTPDAMKQAMSMAAEQLMKRDNLFIKLVKKLISNHVYTKVFVTNEEMDPAVMIQNITSVLQFLPPEAQQPLIKEAMDLMGIDIEIPEPQPAQPPQQKVSMSMNFKDLPPDAQAQMAAEAGIKIQAPQQGGVMQAMQGGQQMSAQQQMTGANTMQGGAI